MIIGTSGCTCYLPWAMRLLSLATPLDQAKRGMFPLANPTKIGVDKKV
jgi:hypothetical protein